MEQSQNHCESFWKGDRYVVQSKSKSSDYGRGSKDFFSSNNSLGEEYHQIQL